MFGGLRLAVEDCEPQKKRGDVPSWPVPRCIIVYTSRVPQEKEKEEKEKEE